MARSTLALLLLASASPLYAQHVAAPRLEVHPWSVALAPRNPVGDLTLGDVGIGGQALLAIAPRLQLVGAGLVGVARDTRPGRVADARLYQLELGVRSTLPAIPVGTHWFRPFVGAGVSERLYDLAAPGFPDRVRFGGYAAAGVDLPIAGRLVTVESRTGVFEGEATGPGKSVAATLADAITLGVHFRFW